MEAAEKQEQEIKKKIRAKERLNAAQLKEENVRAQKYRRQRVEEEQKNDLLIAAYNKKKELAAHKIEAEKQEANAVREKEIARMRELQEKSNDKQAEEDQKRALVYQEQRILKREQEDARKREQKQRLLKKVLAERASQIERKNKADYALAEAEEAEALATELEFLKANARDIAKEQAKRAEVKSHWQSVDTIANQRAQDLANQKQEQLNWDQKFAMNKAVYDHEVSVAYDRMLGKHRGMGHAVPKHFRAGAEEARQAQKAKRKKAQVTRPLW